MTIKVIAIIIFSLCISTLAAQPAITERTLLETKFEDTGILWSSNVQFLKGNMYKWAAYSEGLSVAQSGSYLVAGDTILLSPKECNGMLPDQCDQWAMDRAICIFQKAPQSVFFNWYLRCLPFTQKRILTISYPFKSSLVPSGERRVASNYDVITMGRKKAKTITTAIMRQCPNTACKAEKYFRQILGEAPLDAVPPDTELIIHARTIEKSNAAGKTDYW